MQIAVTLEEVEGKGWVAYASEVGAIAQGVTRQEAIDNLRDLLATYPEVLDEARHARGRQVELIAV